MSDLQLLPFFVLLFCWTTDFSVSLREILYENKASFCYINGHDYPCNPQFTNIVKSAKITVTSSCGLSKPDDVCRSWKYFSTNQHRRQQSHDCKICYRRLGDHYSIANLQDPHNLANQTCWFSGPLYNKPRRNFVNITVDLKKSFEVYYVALQFCSELPDSIAIYKSHDYGYSYSAWQFYSKSCRDQFKMTPMTEISYRAAVKRQPYSPFCIDLNQRPKSAGSSGGGNLGVVADSILPFSTTLFRDLNDSLIDWITITNLRISLLQSERPPRDQLGGATVLDYNKYFFGRDGSGRDILNMSLFSVPEPQFAGAAGTAESQRFVGLSDLSVGGRCQCNGHSNKCVRDPMSGDGELRCDCQHKTSGKDCDICATGFQDRPWARASPIGTSSCTRCHCNLHSSQCHFSDAVFASTGQRSGGVCHKCRHNTDGQHCHYCQAGFYRDWSKPLSHEHACIRCRCHGVGSKNPGLCDQKTGQCFCKTGVTGKRCDRCKFDYQETVSTVRPCLKKNKKRRRYVEKPPSKSTENKFRNDPQNQFMANTESECKPCNEKRKRIRFKKFCRRKAVFMGTIQSREIHGKMVRFEMVVKRVWRANTNSAWALQLSGLQQKPGAAWKSGANSAIIPLWIPHDDVRCECPNIYLGRSYLVLTQFDSRLYRQRQELLLNPPRKSIVLPWRNSWHRRLRKFTLKSSQQHCLRFFQRQKSKIKIDQLSRKMLRRRLRRQQQQSHSYSVFSTS